jgi:membrane protein
MMYWALLTLGPLLFGLSLTVTSQLFMATNDVVRTVPFVGALFYTALSLALTTGAYTLLYVAVPNRFVDWRDAVWGGLVAAIAFEIAKRLFGIFIKQFPNYTIIYGALAALPLFLLWIYLSWMITLVGALITAALPVVKHERWWYEPVPGGAFVDAMAILKVLHAGAKLTNSAMVSSASIRAHTRIGYDEMSALLERMVAVGWVGKVQSGVSVRSRWGMRVRQSDDNWVMLINPEKLRLAEVYRLFVFGGAAVDAGAAPDLDQASPMTLDTGALARKVESAVEQGLEQTLAENFAHSYI